ncbi:helix-turn-helix domain-containing protein [Carnobacterium divergens]|uniref:helix-turn-helix domain-containing protein n=1 Tax=Carnobacterium divergens TaxID=2748 RepID=UPI00288E5512|nr:helix-turn-helix domain-containing protein [Carnobacterium divergens]MDT2012608.1 helix-turn-helix domain-containing protein [Carnobacterium divergens]
MEYEKYAIHDEGLMSFKAASERLGKNKDYLKKQLYLHPEWFDQNTYKNFGKTYLITQQGLDIYKIRATLRNT